MNPQRTQHGKTATENIYLAEPAENTEKNLKFLNHLQFDGFVKSRNSIEFVIPAKAGIQLFQDVLDPGFRRGDDPRDFLRDHPI